MYQNTRWRLTSMLEGPKLEVIFWDWKKESAIASAFRGQCYANNKNPLQILYTDPRQQLLQIWNHILLWQWKKLGLLGSYYTYRSLRLSFNNVLFLPTCKKWVLYIFPILAHFISCIVLPTVLKRADKNGGVMQHKRLSNARLERVGVHRSQHITLRRYII